MHCLRHGHGEKHIYFDEKIAEMDCSTISHGRFVYLSYEAFVYKLCLLFIYVH